jgi:hypothetical protein
VKEEPGVTSMLWNTVCGRSLMLEMLEKKQSEKSFLNLLLSFWRCSSCANCSICMLMKKNNIPVPNGVCIKIEAVWVGFEEFTEFFVYH